MNDQRELERQVAELQAEIARLRAAAGTDQAGRDSRAPPRPDPASPSGDVCPGVPGDATGDGGLRLHALLESVRCGVAVVRAVDEGRDFAFVVVNAHGLDILGLNRADCLDQSLVALIPNAAERGLLDALGRVFRGGPAESLPLANYGTAAQPRWIQHDVHCLPSGEVAIVFHDLTEQKRASDEERALELKDNQAKKMEAIGRLAGGVAHDFNNMLTAITHNARFLLEELKESDPAWQDAAEIDKVAGRAVALTRQLLAFSRRSLAEPRPLDLNATILDVEKLLGRIVRKDIAIRLDLMQGPSFVLAEVSQLEQVLVNLVINARDAIAGGGVVTLSTTAETDSDDREWIVLSVSDTGHGIPPDVIEHIFEPFFTTKSDLPGVGLGLSTVYGIVKQADGQVEVSSEPGAGATFRIRLPRLHASEVPAPPPAVTRSHPAPATVVLVVDDDQAVRRIAMRVLERSGYRVIALGSGEDAVRYVKQHPREVSVVLTDIVMPGMSGPQLHEHLCAMQPGLPVVYMTGYSEEVIARRGADSESPAVVQKPFATRDLVEKIQEVLESAALPPDPNK